MIREFSAGGIVYKRKALSGKQKDNDVVWLIAQHSQHKGWVFPKGLIGDSKKGESSEETAVREVKEETGVEANIVKKLKKPATYFYVWQGEKRFKTVYYFLMEYISGDIKNHDFEMSQVEWLPTVEVEKRLTYKSDKIAFKQALELLL
ncbi:NUDIX domain-containing protein [Candidatus Gottesmanbacteria bacterium]|nr:NUDIX domain-containing protein [Candidatus Gottesmanbacteria bacterium]